MKINNRIYPTLTLEEQALFRKITNEYTFTYNVMLEIGTKKLSFWQMAWLRRKLFKFYKKDINRIRKYIKARKKYEKEHPAEAPGAGIQEEGAGIQEAPGAGIQEEGAGIQEAPGAGIQEEGAGIQEAPGAGIASTKRRRGRPKKII